jgi:hypothetical protein
VAWNKGKAKAKVMIIMMKQSEQWLTGASFGSGFGPVQNPFGHNPLALDLEPDHRSGSSLSLNLGPDHGQVRLGSGSNHGSELNLTIPTAHQVHAPELIRKYHQVVPVTAIKAMEAKRQRLCISPPESLLVLSSAISSHLPLAILSSLHTSSTPSNLYASSSSSAKTPHSNSRMLASIPTIAGSSTAPITTLKATRCRTTPSLHQTSPAPTLLLASDRPPLHHQSLPALPLPSSKSIRRTPKPSWTSHRVSLPPSTSLRVSKARRERYETRESTNWRLSSSMSASNGRNWGRPLRGTSSTVTVEPPISPSPSKMGITSPLTGSDSSPEDKLLGSLRSILLDPPLSS